MARANRPATRANWNRCEVDALRIIIFCVAAFAALLSIVGCLPTGSSEPTSTVAVHTEIFLLVCADPTGRGSPKPLGTAFFVDNHGDIVTAAHLIREAIPFYAKHHEQCVPAVSLGGILIDVTACTADHVDIVGCSLVRNPFGMRHLPEKPTILGITVQPQPLGTPVQVIGYAQRTRDPIETFGDIIGYNVIADSIPAPNIVVEAHGEPGMSGGPILAPDGTVVGIIIDFNPCAPTPGMVCDDIIGRPSSAIQFVINAQRYPWRRLITTKT
jgi:S1-C subfamily serine protease